MGLAACLQLDSFERLFFYNLASSDHLLADMMYDCSHSKIFNNHLLLAIYTASFSDVVP